MSHRAYADALALFGGHGGVDLIGIDGHDTLLAMAMNTARTGTPGEGTWRVPD